MDDCLGKCGANNEYPSTCTARDAISALLGLSDQLKEADTKITNMEMSYIKFKNKKRAPRAKRTVTDAGLVGLVENMCCKVAKLHARSETVRPFGCITKDRVGTKPPVCLRDDQTALIEQLKAVHNDISISPCAAPNSIWCREGVGALGLIETNFMTTADFICLRL